MYYYLVKLLVGVDVDPFTASSKLASIVNIHLENLSNN